jgi:ribosomal protein S8
MLSKKGFRKYINIRNLKRLNNKIGTDIIILSTNRGFLTSLEAQSLQLGGELLFKISF